MLGPVDGGQPESYRSKNAQNPQPGSWGCDLGTCACTNDGARWHQRGRKLVWSLKSFKQQRDGKLPSDRMLQGSKEKGLWFVKSVGKGNMKHQEDRGDRQRDEPMPSAALRTEFS